MALSSYNPYLVDKDRFRSRAAVAIRQFRTDCPPLGLSPRGLTAGNIYTLTHAMLPLACHLTLTLTRINGFRSGASCLCMHVQRHYSPSTPFQPVGTSTPSSRKEVLLTSVSYFVTLPGCAILALAHTANARLLHLWPVWPV